MADRFHPRRIHAKAQAEQSRYRPEPEYSHMFDFDDESDNRPETYNPSDFEPIHMKGA
jgi:hypothetical protein